MRRGATATTVVGTVSSGSLLPLGDGAAMVVSMKTAHRWFDAAGQVDRVRVLVDAAERRELLKAEIAANLPDRLVVQEPASRLRLADEILRSSELALQFAGALALAMAAFIIFNTLRMNFSERRWQLSTMRALGATARQIHRLVTAEGLWFGCVGAALGVPAGVLVAVGLGRAMQQLLGAHSLDDLALLGVDPVRGVRGTGRVAGCRLGGRPPMPAPLAAGRNHGDRAGRDGPVSRSHDAGVRGHLVRGHGMPGGSLLRVAAGRMGDSGGPGRARGVHPVDSRGAATRRGRLDPLDALRAQDRRLPRRHARCSITASEPV